MCVTAGCQCITREATAERRDFDFIQSVGGIAVGEPRKEGERTWFLPVRCDLSGCTAVTCEPVLINSALAVKELHVRMEEDAVLLWIESCVYTDETRSPRTSGVRLDDIGPGRYTVLYLGEDGRRDEIGTVVIEK